MTALPESPWLVLRLPDHLLTIDEYAALGETEPGYTELVEGRVLMSPSPVPDHNYASFELAAQLKPQLPGSAEIIQDVDVNLELVAPAMPGFSRRPDLMIIRKGARKRVREEGGMIKAAEVLVVMEIVSPGSKRTDYLNKREEYADARIPHYWILDLIEPVSMVAYDLTGKGRYEGGSKVTDTFTTTDPFPATVNLAELL